MPNAAPQATSDLLADEYRPPSRELLQTVGHVHCISDHGVVHLPVRADVTDDDRAGVNADPQAQRHRGLVRRVRLVVSLLGFPLDRDSGCHGSFGVVVGRQGRSEVGEHGIPYVLVDGATVRE